MRTESVDLQAEIDHGVAGSKQVRFCVDLDNVCVQNRLGALLRCGFNVCIGGYVGAGEDARSVRSYVAADRRGPELKTTLLMLRSTAHCGMTVELLFPPRKARFCQAIFLVLHHGAPPYRCGLTDI